MQVLYSTSNGLGCFRRQSVVSRRWWNILFGYEQGGEPKFSLSRGENGKIRPKENGLRYALLEFLRDGDELVVTRVIGWRGQSVTSKTSSMTLIRRV